MTTVNIYAPPVSERKSVYLCYTFLEYFFVFVILAHSSSPSFANKLYNALIPTGYGAQI